MIFYFIFVFLNTFYSHYSYITMNQMMKCIVVALLLLFYTVSAKQSFLHKFPIGMSATFQVREWNLRVHHMESNIWNGNATNPLTRQTWMNPRVSLETLEYSLDIGFNGWRTSPFYFA